MRNSELAGPTKSFDLLFFAVVVVALFGACTVLAQEEQPSDLTSVTDAGVPAQPAEPGEAVSEVMKAMKQVEEKTEEAVPAEFTIEFGDTYDWIRLTSGEWLKGDLNWMREKDFEFDSDKLDIITKAWSKVDQLHSPQVNTYVFKGGFDVMGRAVVTKDEVIIETTEGVKTFPRSELLSILEGGRRERDWWSMRLSAGFSGTAGNTNQGSLNASWSLERADQRTHSGIGYDGTFGYANKEQNVNRHVGTAGVRLYIWDRFYVTPVFVEFFNDKFANIRFRATPGAAGGIHIFDTKNADWDFDVGLGYQHLRFLSSAAGVENSQNDGFVSFHTNGDFDITDDVELELDWRTNLVFTQIGLTNHAGSAIFSVEISDIFDFETTFRFYRTENPPPRADGTSPEKNDYQLIVSIALEVG